MTNPAQVASMDAPQHNARVYILSIVTSMGAFLFGYDLAFIGTAIDLAPFQRYVNSTICHTCVLTINRDFGLDGASESVQNAFSANIVSLLQAGCFFGALAAAPVGDKLGRRLALAIGAVAFIVGSIMQTVSAGNKDIMFVGRVIGGVVSIYRETMHVRHC